jgi:hypothetical protein
MYIAKLLKVTRNFAMYTEQVEAKKFCVNGTVPGTKTF